MPDPLQRRLDATCSDLPRTVLTGFAVEAYRSGTSSRAEVGQRLGHKTNWDTDSFLSKHNAWPAPTFDEVTRDLDGLAEVPEP
jgi:hypothetical protein